jgi:acyl dehydratase
MAVQWGVSAYAMRQTRGGVLVTQRTVVEDPAGEPLVEHLWSNLHLGATIDADVGAGKADHSFPEAARANPVGQARIPVDRDQTFRYAGVSSDHIAHAMDDEAARQEGYSGKILQGLCTFAMCSGAVVNIGAGGDPRRLRRLAGRFSAPAYPRSDLVVDLYDAAGTADGGRVVVFEASQDDTIVIKHGRAEFGPD